MMQSNTEGTKGASPIVVAVVQKFGTARNRGVVESGADFLERLRFTQFHYKANCGYHGPHIFFALVRKIMSVEEGHVERVFGPQS